MAVAARLLLCSAVSTSSLAIASGARAQGSPLFHFGDHVFAPPRFLVRGMPSNGNGPQDVRADVLWPSFGPADGILASNTATILARRDEILMLLLSYDGPSFAGRRMADNYLRIHSEPTATPAIPGYDVRGVGLEQDIFIAQKPEQQPEAILCNRPPRRPGDLGRPTCHVIDAIDTADYPIKPDGRWPLTLTYVFAKVHLPEVGLIDRRLRELIASWKVS